MSTKQKCPVVLQTGFRIFFLGAAFHAVVSIAAWMCFYVWGWKVFSSMPVNIWHGHEMLYGYTMAVTAGFLLTAVMNWTGLKTLNGTPLLILFLLWAAARILAFVPGQVPVVVMAACDNAFLVFLIIAISRPVIKVKQWRQSAVLSKAILIFFSSIFFYYGILGGSVLDARKALLFTVYMLVSLIFTVGRRVIPFFIEKGVGYPVTLRNSKILDMASLVLLTLFAFLDVFWPRFRIIPLLSALLALVHTMRLAGWYTPVIWKKPLLWVLFAGYAFLIIGFVLKTLSYAVDLFPGGFLHAFTYGGIGVFTLGMMARVSLGHTGRNLHKALPMVSPMFLILIAGACVRTFLPIFTPSHYKTWIAISQVLWMTSFALFIIIYFPVLISARVDGELG